MSDHKYIYLQPTCCANDWEGRLWCEDDVNDCDEGVPWTKYIIHAEHEKLQAELTAARQEIERLQSPERKERLDIIRRIAERGLKKVWNDPYENGSNCDLYQHIIDELERIK